MSKRQIPQSDTVRMPLNELVPAEYNPRRISDRAMKGLRASLERFGELGGIVWNKRTGRLVGGHQRVKALAVMGETHAEVRVVELDELDEKALNLTLNNPAIGGEWMELELGELLEEAQAGLGDLFADLKLDELWDFAEKAAPAGNGDPDETPEVQTEAVTVAGDVWLLGPHRIICGDSTSPLDVAALIPEGTRAALLHADPPYGMGKEADGVENDNLYAEKLDKFQMAWWRAWRPFLADNASAYIWGTAEDLWRLWYAGGLATSERLTFRNEVVWDKVNGMGMSSDGHRQYATATERCLFFMLGEQGFNTNADNYFEGWEPLRAYMAGEAKRLGWKASDLNRVTGSNMSGHYISTSQWLLPTREMYAKIQAAAGAGAFRREYDDLRREWMAARAFFDNVHDNMRDVWNFDRVQGDERHGHATPKPVAMIVRALKSSCPEGGVVLEPFSGSGTTLMAAEKCGRICYTAELTPEYVDVAVRRWQTYTGNAATLEGDGRTFAEVEAGRRKTDSLPADSIQSAGGEHGASD